MTYAAGTSDSETITAEKNTVDIVISSQWLDLYTVRITAEVSPLPDGTTPDLPYIGVYFRNMNAGSYMKGIQYDKGITSVDFTLTDEDDGGDFEIKVLTLGTATDELYDFTTNIISFSFRSVFATFLTLQASATDIYVGDDVVFTGELVDEFGGALGGETLSIFSNDVEITTFSTAADGTYAVALNFLSAGVYDVTVKYGGS